MAVCLLPAAAEARVSYRQAVDLERSLSLALPAVEGASVFLDGGDSRCPTTPFTFEWGDGSRDESFFPARHTYAGDGGRYTVRVTAHYADGSSDTVATAVVLVPALAFERRVPSAVRLLLPDTPEGVAPAIAPDVPRLGAFAPEAFTTVPPATIEYVLDVAHAIQMDLCNRDVAPRAATHQVVARADDGYGCSLWFLEPSVTSCVTQMVAPVPDWSSLFHESGHNLTLNSPAAYHLGGKTDGEMSAFMSESLAQILAHVTAALLRDDAEWYGISPDLADAVAASAFHTASGALTNCSRDYLRGGMRFCSHDSPDTPNDETLPTFMVFAREFLLLADGAGDYRLPTKRLMASIETWCAEDTVRWQQPDNESFRATFMVAACSHALGRDLRDHFRALGFPISDAVYAEVGARPKAKAR